MSSADVRNAAEFIKDRLYFASISGTPRETSGEHYFTIDNDLIYEPFFADFGPLHLGCTYRFCRLLNQKLKDPALAKKKIIFYTSRDRQRQANGAALIGIYAVMYLDQTGDEAHRPFVGVFSSFYPFRDASYGMSTFNLTVLDVLRAVAKAKAMKFIDFDTFDVEEYEYYEKVENGDFNWLIPGKFLAFSGPHDNAHLESGYRLLTPEDYIPYYRAHNISAVIRLNKKMYKRKKFTDAGFKHYDLYYVDGSNPPEAILNRFLEICESEGVCAVHCKAGLGRTGTCIGMYMMKHYQFTAHEVIGWLRLCRPGSVIGPQQQFLCGQQERMWKEGEAYRRRHNLPAPANPPGDTRNVAPPSAKAAVVAPRSASRSRSSSPRSASTPSSAGSPARSRDYASPSPAYTTRAPGGRTSAGSRLYSSPTAASTRRSRSTTPTSSTRLSRSSTPVQSTSVYSRGYNGTVGLSSPTRQRATRPDWGYSSPQPAAAPSYSYASPSARQPASVRTPTSKLQASASTPVSPLRGSNGKINPNPNNEGVSPSRSVGRTTPGASPYTTASRTARTARTYGSPSTASYRSSYTSPTRARRY